MDGAAKPMISQIRAEIERFIREPPAKPTGVGPVVEHTQVLPAVFDWMAIGGVDANGELVWVEYEPPYRVEPAEPAYVRNMLLHRLAKRYPSLAALDPVRPEDAIDCPNCDGTGVIYIEGIPRPEFSCACGGLGWLPVGTKLPPGPTAGTVSGVGGWIKNLVRRVRRLTRA